MDYTPLIPDVRACVNSSNQILEHHRLVACIGSRLALSLLISAVKPGHDLVGTSTTEAEAVEHLRTRRADVLLCTDRLEAGNGGSLVAAAKSLKPAVKTLMIVTQPRRLITIRQALEAGCDGLCLESQIGRGTVMRALKTVTEGAAYTEKALQEQYFLGYAGLSDAPIAPLTDREVEVLQLVAASASNREIAEALMISVETVKSHVSQILGKLPARDRLHAAVKGIRLGFVDWPEDR